MSIVEENKVVTFEYTLKNDAGEVLDSSETHDPLSYIHGSGQIIPGLEAEIAGKELGAKFNATIAPENAYGIRHEELIKKIEKEHLSHLENLEVGAQLQAQDANGMQILTVVEIGEKDVTLDGNHPLAGETLHFDVEITEIRDASAEELQGHDHGSDCSSGCQGCSGC